VISRVQQAQLASGRPAIAAAALKRSTPAILVALGSTLLGGCQWCRRGQARYDSVAHGSVARPTTAKSSPTAPVGRTASTAELASSPARSVLTQIATIALPHGTPGIGFDDLRFSPSLDKVLVPAGRSGRLDVVDPQSRNVIDIAGFSEQARYAGGHDYSVTSADAGVGVLYAIDRTTQRLAIIDLASRAIVYSVPLAAHPDYVRYLEPTQEVWISEPEAEQLEIFSVGGKDRRAMPIAKVAVHGGPESLVIDPSRSRVYTNLWRGVTVAIDAHSRGIVARWNNGCRSSRGIALDEQRGFVIAACAEGKASVLDVRDGHPVSDIETGAGVDIIDFDPQKRHVYIPSADTATMFVASLSADGRLALTGSVATARDAHCVTSDRQGNAYVCDPAHGRLLVIADKPAPPK
jgi:hypothetical protein